MTVLQKLVSSSWKQNAATDTFKQALLKARLREAGVMSPTPPPRRWPVPGPHCSKAPHHTAARVNGLGGTGSIQQRSPSNSRCKHKNNDIFLMTTKQLKLQECVSSPFSGQYSQHVCAFNVRNTAAQNTLNTSHLTWGLLKVVQQKHTSLLLVLLHKIKTQEPKPQRTWDLIILLYFVIALFVTWSPPRITAIVLCIDSHQPSTCSCSKGTETLNSKRFLTEGFWFPYNFNVIAAKV